MPTECNCFSEIDSINRCAPTPTPTPSQSVTPTPTETVTPTPTETVTPTPTETVTPTPTETVTPTPTETVTPTPTPTEPRKATILVGSFGDLYVYGSYCCDVASDSSPSADACRQPKMLIGSAGGFEVAPVGSPLVGGGVAGDSLVSVGMSSGQMTDRISVSTNNIELVSSNNGNASAIVPVGSTGLEAFIEECYLQTGGWIFLPSKQGTDYICTADYELFVWADDTDLIL